MLTTTLRGDDLANAVRASADAADHALEAAARIAAYRTRNDLKKQARTFGSAGRVSASKTGKGGLADSIRVKRRPGEYTVYSKARYARKRSQVVDLLWVFENAPVVRASNGKPFIAVPIPGSAPIHANGRRVMWPSEALAAGWKLQYVPIKGKSSVLVLGRRNSFDPWLPLFVLVPSVKMPKGFDVEGVFNRRSAEIEQTWGDIVDSEMIGRLTAART